MGEASSTNTVFQVLLDEWHAISQAPLAFIAALLVASGGIFWFVRHLLKAEYQGQINHLQERIRLKEDQIAALKEAGPRPVSGEASAVAPEVGKARAAQRKATPTAPARTSPPKPAPKPTTSPTPHPDQPRGIDGRRYMDDYPLALLRRAFERSGNEAQTKSLLSPFEGQWVRLLGYFGICTLDHSGSLVTLEFEPKLDGGSVTLYFGPEWEGPLGKLERGDEIIVDAQLRAERGRIVLANAELVAAPAAS